MNPETIPSPEIKGDFKPEITNEPDGSKTYILRVVSPKIDSLKSMGQRKAEHLSQEAEMQELGFEGSPADYKKDHYSYKDMFPNCGSPESIPMPENPRLTVGFVRHLPHMDNKVSPEDQEAFRAKAKSFVDSLNIDSETAVYIVTSPAANYNIGLDGVAQRNSRTDDTAEVVRRVLEERGIPYKYNHIDEGKMEEDSTTSHLKRALDEFSVSSAEHSREMGKMIDENIAAKKISDPLPYPDLPTQKPTQYASFAKTQKDLESKTGMSEVSSATVARTLRGFDHLEDHFLREAQLPEGKKRAVVIAAGHGQFGSDISEGLLVATDKAFPFVFASNGASFKINVDLSPDNKSIREYVINDKQMKG